MADYPLTRDQIVTRLNTLQNLIDTYTADPAKFAALNTGSVSISIPEYIRQLREEQESLRTRLRDVPFWIGSDLENTR